MLPPARWVAGAQRRAAGVSDSELHEIYARYRRALFALALSVTGCRLAAEDAVHDAFARLCRCGIRGAVDPVAYVFAAVRNAALDQVRRPRLAGPFDPASESIFADAGPGPQARAMLAERQRLVAAAVDALPLEQREAIVLRVYGGLSFAQMSQVLDAPLPTVATRYRRALGRLRLHLEKLV